MVSDGEFFSSRTRNFFSVINFRLELLKFGECYVSHTLGGIEINFSLMKNLTELTVYDNLLMTDEANFKFSILFVKFLRRTGAFLTCFIGEDWTHILLKDTVTDVWKILS